MRTIQTCAIIAILLAGASAQCNPPGTENFDTAPTSTSPWCGVVFANTYPTGWSLDAASTNNWHVHSGTTSSFGTGPTGDHTTGAGRYLYTDATGCGGSTAILNAPCFDATTTAVPTIEFWYHMYGSTMGSLTLEEFDGVSWNLVWTRSGDQGDNWLLASAPVTPVAGQVMVRFVSVAGNMTSDMAIDDVKFGNPTPPMWQENGPDAYADIDGNWVNTFDANPAINNVQVVNCPNGATPGSATLNFGSNIPSTTFEIAMSPAPVVPIGGGAFTFGGFGDSVHLDVTAPGLDFLNGGAGGIVFSPLPGSGFPGSTSANLTVPLTFSTAVDVSFQAGYTDPSIPNGVQLSQASQLHVTVASAATILATTFDDTAVNHNIVTSNTCYTLAGMPFYGTTYTDIWVTGNGRVTFGAGDSDFTPSITEALTDPPSVGNWVDMRPNATAAAGAQGSVTMSAVGPDVFRIDWNQVDYWTIGTPTTFGIEFDAASGLVTIDNLNLMSPQVGANTSRDNQFLGISPGMAGGATDPGSTTFTIGGGGTPAATDMIYDYYDAVGTAGTPGITASLVPGTLNSIVFAPSGAGYTWAGF